jgi:hypothetical protein
MLARTTASFIVSDLDPTDVAKALATSFAPMPIAATNEKIPPATTIHVYIDMYMWMNKILSAFHRFVDYIFTFYI